MNIRNSPVVLPIMNSIILSCEHASNAVPSFVANLFADQKEKLATHRGYDIGAEPVFEKLRTLLPVLYAAKGNCTRLAIDLNRSGNHPARFSPATKNISQVLRCKLEKIWIDFRNSIEKEIRTFLKRNSKQTILHLSIHTFTPVLEGKERLAEIGLLYDPGCPQELALAKAWKEKLHAKVPECRIRLNYPYQGKSDGHTSSLRKKFGSRYLGIEVEMNQAWLTTQTPAKVARLLAETLPTH